MTDRERLLKILNVPIHPHENVDPLEAVADYLLDNGVTVGDKWTPTAERLPEEYQRVLVCLKNKLTVVARLLGGQWVVSWNNAPCPGVTHWMPLPEPPKEEC